MRNCARTGTADRGGVKRWHYAAELDEGGAGEDVVVGMPEGGRHGRHAIAVWDGFVYAVNGSAESSLSPTLPDFDTNCVVVKRFALDKYAPGRPLQWKDGEAIAGGARSLEHARAAALGMALPIALLGN